MTDLGRYEPGGHAPEARRRVIWLVSARIVRVKGGLELVASDGTASWRLRLTLRMSLSLARDLVDGWLGLLGGGRR